MTKKQTNLIKKQTKNIKNAKKIKKKKNLVDDKKICFKMHPTCETQEFFKNKLNNLCGHLKIQSEALKKSVNLKQRVSQSETVDSRVMRK